MAEPAVLLTSAGRRVSLLQAFQLSAHAREWKVLAADRDPLAPALYLADEGLRVPALHDPNYLPHLLSVVRERNVKLVVPTIDTELKLLADNACKFVELGCTPLVSTPALIEIARDKWWTVQQFSKQGIETPKSWLPDEMPKKGLPKNLFVKPRNGSASQFTFATHSGEVARLIEFVPCAIVQERLEGPEITIDALIDLQGTPVHYVPRTRIRTIGGESIQGVTIADEALRDWVIECLEVVAKLGGRGPVTLQAFLTEKGPVLSEVNPRFGGGFPLTFAAGGEHPEWVLQMVEGKKIEPCFGKYQRNLHMTRYYVEHFTTGPLWEISG